MYNWTEPLPKHIKVDYHECYAKVVLEELYSDEFDTLEIVDKPDLQSINGDYGVEVTIAIDKDQLKAESLNTDICYKRARNVDKASKEIEKCGCKRNRYSLYGKPGIDSFDLVLKAFEDKLDKLNSNEYRYFNKNYLFIFSDIYADEEMLNNVVKDMQERQVNKARKFHKVYVLVPGNLYTLNLDKGIYEVSEIESSRQTLQACKARNFVEMNEKN